MSQCPHAIEPLHERIALERALFADVLALDGERHLKLFARAQLGLHNEQITVRAFGAMIERLTKWRVWVIRVTLHHYSRQTRKNLLRLQTVCQTD